MEAGNSSLAGGLVSFPRSCILLGIPCLGQVLIFFYFEHILSKFGI